jgi:hypothetical protein
MHKPRYAITASAVFPDLTCYAYCTSRNVAIFNDVTSECTSARLQKIHVQYIQFKLEIKNRLYARTAQWPKMPPPCVPALSPAVPRHKVFCTTKCTFWCSTIPLHKPECSPQASYTTNMHYHITRRMYHWVRPNRPPATQSYVSSSVHSPLVLTNGACHL